MFNQVLHEKNDEIIRLKQLLEERYGPDCNLAKIITS
jgi:hypothetical protein